MAKLRRPPRVSADRNHWYSPARIMRVLLHTGPRATSVAVRLVAAFALVAATMTVAQGTANAEPEEEDLATVQKKVRSLGEKVEKVTEDYNQARIKLKSSKKKVKSLGKQMKKQQGEVENLRSNVATMAATAYMSGPTDLATLTTAETPQDVVDRASTLQQLSRQDEVRLDKFDRASKKLKAQRESAADAMSEQRALTSKLDGKKSTIEKTLEKQKELLAKLTPDTKERASRGDRPNMDLPPASGKAGAAIAFAKSQLGKPYQWGAAGPGAYDCSGLTLAAWKKGGVSLPHSSQAQQSSGPSVDRSQLKPGDLVFFGSPVHHVGLYVGGGKMIHAPNSGEVVKYTSINESYYRSNYAGAVRPG